jgi:hypothetical protein
MVAAAERSYKPGDSQYRQHEKASMEYIAPSGLMEHQHFGFDKPSGSGDDQSLI